MITDPNNETFSRSAGRQIAVLAVYALLAVAVLLWILSVATARTGGRVTSGAIDVENNAITIALRQEPPQLDHTRSSDASSMVVLQHSMEGLLGYDDNVQLTAGVAERWEVRDDGATFWLRDDAYWSDGEPVTAHDFVFGWRKALEPATASTYAFILYPVENAEEINQGKLPPEALGVYAVNDRQLEVRLKQPTPYFDKLVAFITYFPLREDFFEAQNGAYGADADKILYNGPYIVTEWVHSASMRWEKNPLYWNRENKGFIDTINVGYITEDVNAKLNMFKDGQIADTHLEAPMLGSAMEQRWQIDRIMDGSMFYVGFNFREGRFGANANFRKALQLAYDPVEFVYKAMKEPSWLPGASLFPVYLNGVDGLFREEYPAPVHQPDAAEARRHLELARQELGLEEWPPIVLLADDTPAGTTTSEYLQAAFKRILGLDLRIDKQIFKQRLAKSQAGEYDLLISGWSPDYFDALTFGDLFASWNMNNRGRYASEEYDAMVAIAQSSLDPRERMDAFGRMQEIIYEDAVMLPLYERGRSFVVNPQLEGFKRRALAPEVDYNYARIVSSE